MAYGLGKHFRSFDMQQKNHKSISLLLFWKCFLLIYLPLWTLPTFFKKKRLENKKRKNVFTSMVTLHDLFCSLAVLDPRVGHTVHVHCTFSIYLCPRSFWLTHTTGSPVHVLMSIKAVRGLPRLRAPGIVPCTISFSPCFLVVWPW